MRKIGSDFRVDPHDVHARVDEDKEAPLVRFAFRCLEHKLSVSLLRNIWNESWTGSFSALASRGIANTLIWLPQKQGRSSTPTVVIPAVLIPIVFGARMGSKADLS
jgi:hypothetical protein